MASDAPDAEKGTVKLQALARGTTHSITVRCMLQLIQFAVQDIYPG